MDVNEADNKEHFLGKCFRSRERKNNTSEGKILIAVFAVITRICSGLRNLQFVPLPVSRSGLVFCGDLKTLATYLFVQCICQGVLEESWFFFF